MKIFKCFKKPKYEQKFFKLSFSTILVLSLRELPMDYSITYENYIYSISLSNINILIEIIVILQVFNPTADQFSLFSLDLPTTLCCNILIL